MKRVPVDRLKPGMILARTIYSHSGEPLLKEGIKLKNKYISNLQTLNINNVYIRDDRLENVVVDDIVSDESRMEAKRIITQYFSIRDRFVFLKDLENNLLHTADKIVNEVLNNKQLVINLQDIKSSDTYTFDHCVNVCILSVIAGMKLNMSRDDLTQLAIGSLLHDLGKSEIPAEILNKKGPLTREEFKKIKEHAARGFNLYRGAPLFSDVIGAVILQHHERYAGHGYPHGLKEREISRFAQIVSVADVYDAVTSKRPYRKAFHPHKAIEMFQTVGGVDFNIKVLNAFLSFIPAYPVGTHVLLNNGESGLVIGNTPGFSTRPIVRVLYTGEEFAPHSNPYEVNLVDNTSTVIIGIKDEGEDIPLYNKAD